jgi:2-keto-4-pentenoate hydratase
LGIAPEVPNDERMTADLSAGGGTAIAAPTAAEEAIARAVERLTAAAASGVPCAPVRDLIDRDDVAGAYRVQQQIIAAALATGVRRVGRKIGLTSAAVQKQLGVDQPDFGVLLSNMVVGEDDAVPADRLLQPRIEAEIAFVLGADITSADPSLDEVAAAVAQARPALEIVDSRVAGWDISIADTVADNASSGLYVLGETAVALADLDPVAVTMTMTQDGVEVSSGSGAACLGNPLVALQWLARQSAEFGEPLRAGEVVLSGALGPMVPVQAGSVYEAELVGLGSVRATFAAREGSATPSQEETP